ncbi:helix-turn-helix domain-containing protein [Rugosimonospora acidiphila]|uniref:helix-turn-helix domain-containing protein n=1 Tax=Rugosimonospora acidiphila TaxID=556531 RepID=UPI003CD067DD
MYRQWASSRIAGSVLWTRSVSGDRLASGAATAARGGLALDGSVPDGSAPGGSLPDGSLPDGSLPDGSLPDGSLSDSSETIRVRLVTGGGPAARVTSDRILPDGCLDLIWASGTLLVAGPDTRAWLSESAPGTAYVGLRFAPGTGPAVLGVPACELRDSRVELAALWRPAVVRRIAERIAEAGDPAGLLESVALDAMTAGSTALGPGPLSPTALSPTAAGPGAPDAWAGRAVASLRAGASVRALAERVGLGERQLHRRCLTLFGYGPKTLARVLRFDSAVALARRGVPFADVAARTGYADQAHLSRDVRALAGVPLGTLIRD